MAYADATKYNRVRSMKGLPIGAIVPWASDQSFVPPGWVICNGVVTSITRYPLLFDVIGNTYGGTPGSTFRLPPLTSSAKGIVDVFVGHYQWLRTNGGEAGAPVSNSISNDRFWSIIADGDGNQGSTAQDQFPTTIDVEGQFRGSPNFYGLYDAITVSDGQYSWTSTWDSRRLTDRDLQGHTHANSEGGADSYTYEGGAARQRFSTNCNGDSPCNISSESTSAFRVAANPEVSANGDPWFANNRTHLDNNLRTNDFGNDGSLLGSGSGGGGTIANARSGGSGGRGESGSTVYTGGDGGCTGSMSCNWTTLFTSLAGEVNESSPHEHGSTTYNISGRYNVISPGLRDNIRLNTVTINNTPGRNFGSIQATTSTPSLEMIYLIRAY